MPASLDDPWGTADPLDRQAMRARMAVAIAPHLASDPAVVAALSMAPYDDATLTRLMGRADAAADIARFTAYFAHLPEAHQRKRWEKMTAAEREALLAHGFAASWALPAPPVEAGGGGFLGRMRDANVRALGMVGDAFSWSTAAPRAAIGGVLEGFNKVHRAVLHVRRADTYQRQTDMLVTDPAEAEAMGLDPDTYGQHQRQLDPARGGFGQTVHYDPRIAAVRPPSKGLLDAWRLTKTHAWDLRAMSEAFDALGTDDPELFALVAEMAAGGDLAEMAAEHADVGTAEYEQAYVRLAELASRPNVAAAVEVLGGDNMAGSVSLGRDLARGLGLDPGSPSWHVVSGGGDAAVAWYADPFLVAGKVNKAHLVARHALDGADPVANLGKVLRDNADELDEFARTGEERFFGHLTEAFEAGGERTARLVELGELAPRHRPLIAHLAEVDEAARLAGGEGLRSIAAVKDWLTHNPSELATFVANPTRNNADHLFLPVLGRLRAGLGGRLKAAATDTIDFLGDFSAVTVGALTPDELAAMGLAADEAGRLSPLALARAVPDTALQRWGTSRIGLTAAGVASIALGPPAAFVHAAANLVPKAGFMTLDGPQMREPLEQMLAFGFGGGRKRWWLTQILDEADPAARRRLIGAAMTRIFERAGVLDTPEGAEWAGRYLDYVTQRYSAYGRDELETIGGVRHVGLFPDMDAADAVALPDFAKLLGFIRKTNAQRVFYGAANNRYVDWFMGRLWKPSVLLRIGFIPRAAADEVAGFIVRASPARLVRAWATHTALGVRREPWVPAGRQGSRWERIPPRLRPWGRAIREIDPTSPFGPVTAGYRLGARLMAHLPEDVARRIVSRKLTDQRLTDADVDDVLAHWIEARARAVSGGMRRRMAAHIDPDLLAAARRIIDEPALREAFMEQIGGVGMVADVGGGLPVGTGLRSRRVGDTTMVPAWGTYQVFERHDPLFLMAADTYYARATNDRLFRSLAAVFSTHVGPDTRRRLADVLPEVDFDVAQRVISELPWAVRSQLEGAADFPADADDALAEAKRAVGRMLFADRETARTAAAVVEAWPTLDPRVRQHLLADPYRDILRDVDDPTQQVVRLQTTTEELVAGGVLPPVRDGMVRLYRGDTVDIDTGRPPEVVEVLDEGAEDGFRRAWAVPGTNMVRHHDPSTAGRWWSTNPQYVRGYAGGGGSHRERLRYVDLPADQVEAWRTDRIDPDLMQRINGGFVSPREYLLLEADLDELDALAHEVIIRPPSWIDTDLRNRLLAEWEAGDPLMVEALGGTTEEWGPTYVDFFDHEATWDQALDFLEFRRRWLEEAIDWFPRRPPSMSMEEARRRQAQQLRERWGIVLKPYINVDLPPGPGRLAGDDGIALEEVVVFDDTFESLRDKIEQLQVLVGDNFGVSDPLARFNEIIEHSIPHTVTEARRRSLVDAARSGDGEARRALAIEIGMARLQAMPEQVAKMEWHLQAPDGTPVARLPHPDLRRIYVPMVGSEAQGVGFTDLGVAEAIATQTPGAHLGYIDVHKTVADRLARTTRSDLDSAIDLDPTRRAGVAPFDADAVRLAGPDGDVLAPGISPEENMRRWLAERLIPEVEAHVIDHRNGEYVAEVAVPVAQRRYDEHHIYAADPGGLPLAHGPAWETIKDRPLSEIIINDGFQYISRAINALARQPIVLHEFGTALRQLEGLRPYFVDDALQARAQALAAAHPDLEDVALAASTRTGALPANAPFDAGVRSAWDELAREDRVAWARAATQAAEAERVMTAAATQRTLAVAARYIDDHRLRSQLDHWIRNVVPFQFAEVQFLKRWARTFTHSPEAIRKMQLLYMGVRHAGWVEQNEFGEDVFVYPLSEEVVGGLARALDVFAPGQWSLPIRASMVGQVRWAAPGIDEPGRPGFAPIVGLPLNLVARIFPELGGPVEDLLGERGAGRSVPDLVVPASVMRFWRSAVADPDRDAQFGSAVFAAMQIMEAKDDEHFARTGQRLIPGQDATAKERQDYLDRVRNWARVLLITRGIIGFTGPASPTHYLPEDLAPEFKAHLSDQLGAGATYEEALASFLEAHPDARPHTVFGHRVPSKAPLPATADALAWVQANRDFLAHLPMAGPWFLPASDSAEPYERRALAEYQALGLREHKDMEDRWRDLKWAEAADVYFAGAEAHEQALAGLRTVRERNAERQAWAAWKQAYFAQHPVFAEMLTSPESRNERRAVMAEMAAALERPEARAAAHYDDLAPLVRGYQAHLDVMASLSGDTSARATRARAAEREAFAEWVGAWVRTHPATRTFYWRIIRPDLSVEADLEG